MPFPVSVRFTTSIPTAPGSPDRPDGTLTALLTALRLEGADRIEQRGAVIRFRLPWLRNRTLRSNWHPLAYATGGTLALERRDGRLRLSGTLSLGLLIWPVLPGIVLFYWLLKSWIGASAVVALAGTVTYLVCWHRAEEWATELLHQVEGPGSEAAAPVAT